MSKALRITLIVLGVLAVLAIAFHFIVIPKLLAQTKKASPEQIVNYDQGDFDLEVFYCRPSKRDRLIFGPEGTEPAPLVPYGKIWRTGANEATTFETKTDIKVGGQPLPAGKYSIFTIPSENGWDVIFNSKTYSWGVAGFNGESPIDRAADIAIAKGEVSNLTTVQEMFTITFSQGEATYLNLEWDMTNVRVPISY
ncbi:MAG: DUF2911 domain-containing protein [Bacteroidota bacterium]